MLENLRAITLFVRAVELGSFRAVANSFNISPSVVSHQITQLEEAYSVALLYRSTRKLSLTDDGKRFYEHARQMVSSATDALNSLTENSLSPHGKLTISMPAGLVRGEFTEKIATFVKEYPNISLSLHCSDERVDLIADGIDLALRTGELSNSILKSRRIGAVKRKLVCAPDYLGTMARPSVPAELESWSWIRLKMLPPMREFLGPLGEKFNVHYKPRLEASSVEAMYQLALHGAGLATPPEYLVEDDLNAGRLVHILPEWKIPDMKVFAVWPPNAPQESLSMRFLNYLEATSLAG